MSIEALVILGITGLVTWRLVLWLMELARTPAKTPDPWGPEVDQALNDPDTVPICPHCLTPQRHNGWFCPECGSTVGPYANYLPNVYIFSMGDAVRRSVSERVSNRPLVMAGSALLTLVYFSLLAPIAWIFLLLNRQRADSEFQAAPTTPEVES